jgi:hypothetical protein
MKLTNEELNVIEVLRNLSGESTEKIHNILKSLMIYALMQYSEKEQTTIPYFGQFFIKYKKDIMTNEGLEACLDTFFVPSALLKQNIGEYEDFKNNKLNINEVSIIKYFRQNIDRSLRNKLNDESLESN